MYRRVIIFAQLLVFLLVSTAFSRCFRPGVDRCFLAEDCADDGDGGAANSSRVAPIRSLRFNGTSDYVTVGNLNLEQFTFSVWMKLEEPGRTNVAAPDRIVMSPQGGGWGIYFDYSNSTSELRVTKVGVSNVGLTFSPTSNRWYHVAITHNGERVRYYIDGEFKEEDVHQGGGAADANYTLGSRGTEPEYLKGSLADIRLYNTVLSDSENAKIYNGGKPNLADDTTKDKTKLRAWWKLNEGSGTTFSDSSDNGINGTINSAQWSTDVP